MTSPSAFRLVASDIDGTLIRTDGTLSPRHDRRPRTPCRCPPCWSPGGRCAGCVSFTTRVAKPIPAVCAKRCRVYGPDADKVRGPLRSTVDMLLDVTKRLREAVPDLALAVEVEDSRSFWHDEAWPMRGQNKHHAVRMVSTGEELTAAPAAKLLARSAPTASDDFLRVGQPDARWRSRRPPTRRRPRWWRSPRAG